MGVLRVMLLLAVGVANSHGQTPGDLPPVEYSHRVVLDQYNMFVMLWTPHADTIEIELQVETKGYVGLGFSPNGGMTGADIVLGWVDTTGKIFLHDHYAAGDWAPTVDEYQDVTLLGGYQNDTHTVLRFSRPWRTLDIDSDYVLGEDTVRVIWSYSNSDPTSETDLHYHDARGTKSLYLQSPQFKLPPMGSDVKHVDLLFNNVSIPSNMDTLYWCKLFKMPNITTKHHIIGYIPVVQKENLEHVHHIVVNECNMEGNQDYYEKWVEFEGTQCYSANMPPSWKLCSAIFAWAVGGEGEMFPEHVGFPMGEDGATSYFMMEMHYDNPNFREGVVDSSGIRFFYTDKLRQHDAGTIVFGHNVSPFQIIPPTHQWQTSGYCDTSCTQQYLPPDGVKLFQGLLHSHTLGKSLVLRHGRNGQELPPIIKDMNYDFNYQNTRILKENVTVLPGDSLIMECGYNTSHHTTPTFGGFGSNEEMCLAFLGYYPRTNLFMCASEPSVDTILNGLDMEMSADNKQEVTKLLNFELAMDWEIENKMLENMARGNQSNEVKPLILSHMLYMMNVTAPPKYFNRTLYSILEDRSIWKDERTAALQKAVLDGNHSSKCFVRSNEGLFQKSSKIITAPNLKPLRESLPEVSFMHSTVLDQQGSYVMLWTPRKEDIVFELQVGTTGYVGLGFSPSGGMTGADIVMGWVDDGGEVFLHDRYAEGDYAPMLDESQDVKLLGGYQNDTHTVLRFSRPWNTCDEKHDNGLNDDTVRVIWAYSNRDPASETDLHYHDARGTKSLYLQSPPFELPEMGPDVKTIDFLSPNVSLPDNIDTLYWCKIYKMPPVSVKHHIIGFVPIIEEKNTEHVHHILFYECHVPNSDTHFEDMLDKKGAQCHTPNMPQSFQYCKSVLVGWAVGGQGEMFPEHAGFPMREEYDGATYFLMETHYDNPNLRKGVVDSSGLRLFYTEKLRQYDAGLLMVGHRVSMSHIIPPRQERFISSSFCDGSCTEQTMPTEGVKFFQGVLHSHLLGASIVVRHVRDGQELPMILKDMKYDFNYQSTRILKEEITLLPGDTLITECYYNSSQRNNPTTGGLQTQEEMCLAFLSYYPRTKLSSCLSEPQLMEVFKSVGVTKVEFNQLRKPTAADKQEKASMTNTKMNEDMNQEIMEITFSDLYRRIKITAPEKYINKTMYDILYNETNWQDHMTVNALHKMTTGGVHQVECTTHEGNKFVENVIKVPYPSFKTRRHETDQCSQFSNMNSLLGDRLCPSVLPHCRDN